MRKINQTNSLTNGGNMINKNFLVTLFMDLQRYIIKLIRTNTDIILRKLLVKHGTKDWSLELQDRIIGVLIAVQQSQMQKLNIDRKAL